MKTDENQRNSMKFNETQWKSMKIDENRWKSYESWIVDENRWKSMKSMKLYENQFRSIWFSLRFNDRVPGVFFQGFIRHGLSFFHFLFIFHLYFIFISFHRWNEMKYGWNESISSFIFSEQMKWMKWNENEMISSFHLSFVSLLNSRSGSAHLFISRVPAPGSSTSNSTWFKIFKKQLPWNVLIVLFLKTD